LDDAGQLADVNAFKAMDAQGLNFALSVRDVRAHGIRARGQDDRHPCAEHDSRRVLPPAKSKNRAACGLGAIGPRVM
jgi:hypothetical protein